MSILKPTDSQTTIRVLNSELGETEKKINKIGNSANKSTASIQYLEETLLGSIAFDPNGVPQYDTDDYGNIIYDITGNAVYKRNDDGLLSRLQQEIIGKADDGTVREYILKTSQLEQTVDGFDAKVQRVEANYGTLESRVSTAESKITADAIVNTVTGSEVFSNLSSRVSTAESKITDSAIINTVTSSKTYTDALSGKVSTTTYNSKMQQLDNAISSKVESDTYNSYVEQTDSAISSKVSSTDYTGAKVTSMINQSADSVKIQAKHVEVDGTLIIGSSAVDSKINGIQIGGENLLSLKETTYNNAILGEQNNGVYFNVIGSAEVMLNGSATTTEAYYTPFGRFYNLSDKTKYTGGTYTFSCEYEGSFTGDVFVLMSFSTTTGAYGGGSTIHLNNNKPVTFTLAEGTSLRFMEIHATVGTTCNNLIIRPKLERGNKATSWNISPLDMNDVGNGANMLLDSKRTVANANYSMADYKFAETPIEGEIYTVQIKGTLGSDRPRWSVYNSGGSVNVVYISKDSYDPTTGIYRSCLRWRNATSTSSAVTPTFLRIYQGSGSTQTSTSTIEWVKLEKGCRATAWDYSTTDTNNKIDGIKVGVSNLVQDINKWEKSPTFTFINRADAHLNLMSSANDILNRSEGWTSAGIKVTRLHDGCTGWHVEGTATSTTTISIFGANTSAQRLIDKTKTYTWSATVKRNTGTMPVFNISTSTSAYAFNTYYRTESGKTSLVITPSSTDYAWRYGGIDVVSGKTYYCDIYFKLEEGGGATPYSIAPYDLDNDADTYVFTKRDALTWSNYTNLAYSSKVSDILGKDFTLSFDWKATSSTSSPTITFGRFNAPFNGTSGTRGKYVAPSISSLVVGNRTGGVITTLENKQVSAEWKRFVVTFRINDVSFFTQGTGDYDYFGITLYNYANSTDNALYIKNLKLEEGNKPTAYTPSNEELTSVTRRVRIDNDSVDIIDGDGEMVASYGEHITLKTGDLRLPNPKSFQIKDENNDTYRPLVGLKIGGDRTSNGWEWTIDQYGTVEATVRDKTEFTAQNTPFVTGLYYHDDTKSMVGLINQINAYKTKYAPTELANLNYDEPQEVHVLSTANGNSGSGYLTIWRTYFDKSDKMLHIRFVSNLQATPGTTYHTHKVYIIPSES